MADRIVFDGQEYDGIEAMPMAVRAAYLDRVAPGPLASAHSQHFLDAHLEAKRIAGRVLPLLLGLVAVGILAFGGWALWGLTGSAAAQGVSLPIRPGFLALVVTTGIVGIGLVTWMVLHPESAKRVLGALDSIGRVAARMLQILLAVAAGGVAAGGYWMISRMDASSRSQGGDVFVGVGLVLALGCIAGMYVAIERGLRE